jgi:DNA ligase 1
MKLFASLISRIDQSNKTNDKVDALVDYFQKAPDDDKVWAIALLSGRRPRRHVTVTKLWQWANEFAKIPEWLFQESYNEVGDLSETIALLLPECEVADGYKLSELLDLLKSLEFESEERRKEIILEVWKKQSSFERFVFIKLITGSYRIGVSQNLVIRALAKYINEEPGFIAHRMMGNWSPDTITFKQLFEGEEGEHDISRPYPFFLAYPHEGELNKLGEPEEWQAEWKWDGIRGQMINRKGNFSIWSRGEDLITEKFPEFTVIKDLIPLGTVLDGEIMPWKDGPLPFNVLQTRIGRKNVSAQLMKKAPLLLLLMICWSGREVM